MVWDFESNSDGAVISGRTVRVKGQLHDNGSLIPGYENPHTFSFDIEQIRGLMFDENFTESEALENMLVRYVRDLSRSVDSGPGDSLPSPPTSFPGFNNKSVRGEPKAHRDGASPPAAPSPPVIPDPAPLIPDPAPPGP